MLEWLENTAMARMVQESLWGYPIVLASHAVGMAILAGIVLMINFRALGLAPRIPLGALRPIYRAAWIGLVINVVSGVMLFSSQAQTFVDSKPFILKIIFLVLGITLFIVMCKKMFREDSPLQGSASPMSLKVMALLSTFLWVGVIVMGRLIAYWDVGAF